MTDLIFSISLTLSITFITILADWLTSHVIILSRFAANAIKTFKSGHSNEVATKQMMNTIRDYEISKANLNIWGSELSTVTISLDFVALGLWIYNKGIFPFISRFNVGDVNREIYVWSVILAVHFILFLLSVVFKHLHFNNVKNIDSLQPISIFSARGLALNTWKIATNSIGFITLLSAIIILTNSI